MQCMGTSLTRILRSEVVKNCRTVGHGMFNKYLLFTNVGISMSLSAVGDVIQQNYEIMKGEQEKCDKTRTLHMSISGMTVGILCHYTYQYLDIIFTGRTFKTVMKKVVVDQLVCSPLCIGLFFVTLSCLENTNMHTLKNEITQKGWRLYIAEWIIWPPAQVINFYVLPLKFRVLYDNTISLGYDVYTSYVKHKIPLNVNENCSDGFPSEETQELNPDLGE